MTQLSFMHLHVSKESKRKAEKLMARYKVLDAIIESKQMDLEPSVTQNYNVSESQRVDSVSSPTEQLAAAHIELAEYTRMKRKLELVYDSLKPIQQRIWEQRYMMGCNDSEVYNDLNMNDRTYYRLKREMILIVAEAFGLTE